MGYNNNRVTKPVSFKDVQSALGVSYTGLAQLCICDNINKWAMYKPISHTSIGVLSESDRGSKTYGLSAVQNAKAIDLYKGNIAANDTNFNAAVTSSYDWKYTKPTGGSSSPYRLADFVDPTSSTRGYYHLTPPPIEIEGNAVFTKDQLTAVANTYWVTATVPSGDITNWRLQIYTTYTKSQTLEAGLVYSGYKARWGTASQDNINGASTDVIPLTYLLGDAILNQNWRMGLLVYAPAVSGLFSAEAGLFVSKTTLKYAHANGNSGTTGNMISVDLCTNQLLAQHMLACFGSASTMNFRALPVMVKDCYIQYTNAWISGQEHGRSYITNNNSGATSPQIYSLPSGSMEIKITINSSGGGGSDTSDRVAGPWTLGTKFSGTYIQSGGSTSVRAINNLCIFVTNNTSGGASRFTVDLDYESTSPNGVTTRYTINSTYNATAGQKFTSNGNTYYGIILIAMPELVIKTIRTFTYTAL